PTGSLWLLIPLTLLLFLPLLARRRFPFGAPAAIFIYAAAVSFFEGRLVVFPFGIFLFVLTCSFLFGMLPERRQAVSGLGIRLGACGACCARSKSASARPCSSSNRPAARRLPRCGGWLACCDVPRRRPRSPRSRAFSTWTSSSTRCESPVSRST